MLEPVGLDQQVVDQVDAEVDVLHPRQPLGAGGLGVALAVEVDRVPAGVRAPIRAARAAAARRSPSRRGGAPAAAGARPRAKRFAL